MPTIMSLPETTVLSSDDYVLVEYNGNAARIPVQDFMYATFKAKGFNDNANAIGLSNDYVLNSTMSEIYYRRNTFRGKFLGTSMNASHFAGLANGTPDLYIGDYWIISSQVWRVADFDYLLGQCSDTNNTRIKNHTVQIVNDAGYYYQSSSDFGAPVHTYYTTYYPTNFNRYNASDAKARTTIGSWIPSGYSIQPYVEVYADPGSYGGSTTVNEAVGYVNWLSEYQVFGRAFGRTMSSSASATANRVDNRERLTRQLALFKIAPEFIWPMYSSSAPNGYPVRTYTKYSNGAVPYYGYIFVKPNGTVGLSTGGTYYNRLWFSVAAS